MIRSIRKRRPALVRGDVLISLVALGLVLGLLMPALQRARAAAGADECKNNLKQLALALHNINDTYGRLPPLAGSFPLPPVRSASDATLFFYLLPFVEKTDLYKAGGTGADFQVWIGDVYSKPVKLFHCPDDKTGGKTQLYDGWLALTSYAANFQVFGDVPGDSLQGSARIPATFTDGLASTIVFAERYQLCHGEPCGWAWTGNDYWAPAFARYTTAIFQISPTATQCDPERAQTAHAKGMHVAKGDGSVRVLTTKLRAQTWWYACTPSGGEVLGEDWNP